MSTVKNRVRLTAVAATTAIAAAGLTAGPASAAHSKSKGQTSAKKAKKGKKGKSTASTAATPTAAFKGQTLNGDMVAGGIKVKFNAKRAAGSKTATGFFSGEGAPVAAMGLPSSVGSVRFSGPITCLETHGQDASFYYDFDKDTLSGLLGSTGSGMIVSLKKDDASTYRMGFTPMLKAFVPMVGCDVSTAPLFVTSGGWQTGN